MAIRTILAAVAPDSDGGAVVARAAMLATAHGARLLLLRVIEELPEDLSLPQPASRNALQALLQKEALESLRKLAAGTDAELLLETGKAYAAIRDVATRHGVDLLLIGPGKPRNLREKMFGSTADRLINSAPCPLLLVKQQADGAYLHAVCGIDFSDESKRAVKMAARMAPEARFTLLHMVEIPLSFEQAMLKSGVAGEEVEKYRKSRILEARRRLRREYGKLLPPPVALRVVHGDPAEGLIRASRLRASAFVAIGAQGAGRVSERVLGSVARKVLLRARSDVLLIPG